MVVFLSIVSDVCDNEHIISPTRRSELSCPEVSSSARAESLSDISIHLPSIQKWCIDYWKYRIHHIPNNWGVSSFGPEVSSSARAESPSDISMHHPSIQKLCIDYWKYRTYHTPNNWGVSWGAPEVSSSVRAESLSDISYINSRYRYGVLIIRVIGHITSPTTGEWAQLGLRQALVLEQNHSVTYPYIICQYRNCILIWNLLSTSHPQRRGSELSWSWGQLLC